MSRGNTAESYSRAEWAEEIAVARFAALIATWEELADIVGVEPKTMSL